MSKNIKKISLLLVVLFLLFDLFGCRLYKTYKDTNGDDDYSLQSISEEMLIKNKHGLDIGAVSNRESKDGTISIYKSVATFNGVARIEKITKGTYEFTVSFKVSDGNARLVITDGSQIIHEFNINEDDQVLVLTCDKDCEIKLAGEDCSYELNILISVQ